MTTLTVPSKARRVVVPWLGGPPAELFVLAVAAPLEKRREDWVRRIAQRPEELQQPFADFDPKRLLEN